MVLKQVGRKKIIFTLILIGVFLFTSFVIMCINFNCNKEKNNITKPFAIHNLSNGLTESSYKNNTYFAISTPDRLQYFSTLVATGDYDFAGKTVLLAADLDMSYCAGSFAPVGSQVFYGYSSYEGEEPFRGTFDGQGHTVSNISMGVADEDDCCLGFFGKISSVNFWGNKIASPCVKNLKIKNINITKVNSKGDSYIGGLVGYVDGDLTIENCSVENVIITTESSYACAGGIVGYSKQHGDQYTSASGSIIRTYYNSLNISNCSINYYHVYGTGGTTTSAIGPCKGDGGVTLWASVADYGIFVGKYKDIVASNIESYKLVRAHMTGNNRGTNSSYERVFTDAASARDEFNGLSSKSYFGGSRSELWYFATHYNDGWPVLRQFLDWQTIYFNASDEHVSPTVSSITIPSDAEEMRFGLTNGAKPTQHFNPSFTMYDHLIDINLSTGYVFSYWWYVDGQYYVCSEPDTVTIGFFESDYTNETLYENGETHNVSNSRIYYILVGSTINFEWEFYGSEGKAKTCTISFTDRDGVVRSVKYQISNNMYFISGLTLELVSVDISTTTDSYTVTNNVKVHVDVELKTYNVLFK